MESIIQGNLTENYDEFQVSQMQDLCIAVDEHDNVLGPIKKLDCHLMSNINKGIIHRAFSIILFNEKNEYLLTQRADEKITFPGQFTNACCSHPLYNKEELEHEDYNGVKKAALRRAKIELGIDLSVEDLKLVVRYIYRSVCDSIWGELELAYVFVVRKNVTLNPNPKEVKSVLYVSKEQYKKLLAAKIIPFTRWSSLLACDEFLYKWWDHLDNLSSVRDIKTIHKLGF